LEDDAGDAELTRDMLEGEAICCDVTRVETEPGFVAALQRGGFDLILADYTLPSFDGLSALRIARQQRPDIPFIFISGTLGEEVAIEALKIGASDYVLKSRLSRLVPSVQRALREAAEKAERRRSEEALRRSEAKISRLVDANIIGVLISNFEGQIIEANEAFLKMVGYSREELASGQLRWTDLTPPEWQAASQRAVEQIVATRASDVFEKEYFRRDGSRVPVLVGGAGLEGDSTVSFVLDLTERRRAEEERERLRQLEADLAHVNRVSMLGELAASLSHELKQPIAAAIASANSCVRWLARDPPDVERARAAAMRIEKDGTRAAEIIDRLRCFYKKGSLSERELVDVNEVMGEMLALLRGEAYRYSISMRTDLEMELPKIVADRVQLQQVFMNLMLNGIEAMKDTAGELTMKSEFGQDSQLLISVSDAGVGLPAKDADKIFNAFFTTKPEGTGMGLAISRSIIESHGGHLWATNNAGPGATFRFTLPTASAIDA